MAASTDDDIPDPFDPRRNTAFRGHVAAERAVLDAWNAKRMPHAWLFTGPSGIGKASFAYRVARFVLAGGGEVGLFGDGPDSLHVDPASGTVKRIASGGHPDLRVLEKGMVSEQGRVTENVINAYQARRMVEFLYQTPAESEWKVLIVDGADDFNPAAANALLKAMEEPPSRALILLTANRPGALLPTIRSRCRSLPMRPMPDEDVSRLLEERKPDLPTEERALLVQLAEGSIGRALALADAGGVDLYRGMIGLIARLGRVDPISLHTLADTFARKGAERDFDTFRQLFSWWGQRQLRNEAAGEDAPIVLAEEGEAVAALRALPGSLPHRMDLWDRTAALLAQADPPSSLDKRGVVLQAFLGLDAAARGG